MSEFKFNESQCKSLKICGLPDITIQEIEKLLDSETALIEHFRKVKFKIPKGQIEKILGHISELQKLLSEFDVDNVHVLRQKNSLLVLLQSTDKSLMKIKKRKAEARKRRADLRRRMAGTTGTGKGTTGMSRYKESDKKTHFHDEIDDLAPKIAKILLNHGIKIDRRGRTFKGTLGVVFKAIGVDRKPRTAIDNCWEPEIRLRVAYAEKKLDYDSLVEELEESD